MRILLKGGDNKIKFLIAPKYENDISIRFPALYQDIYHIRIRFRHNIRPESLTTANQESTVMERRQVTSTHQLLSPAHLQLSSAMKEILFMLDMQRLGRLERFLSPASGQ